MTMPMVTMLTGLLVGFDYARAEITDCQGPYSALAALQNMRPEPSEQKKKDAAKAVDLCEKERTRTSGDCESARGDFKSTVEKYKTECSAAGLPDSPDTGSIACSAQADPTTTAAGRRACACAEKDAAKNNIEACEGVTEEMKRGCPGPSDAAADRLARELKDAQDRVDKLRDKADKSDENQGNTDDKASEKASQARKAKAQAKQEYEKSIAEAKNAQSDAAQEMTTAINGVQEKIFAVNQKLTESRQADSQAFASFQKQKMDIELGCYSQATQAVNQMTSEAVAHIKDGTYNIGSQNDLFRRVGITDRQNWQRQAKIRKQWCMDSEPTHDAQKAAELAYNETLKNQAASRQQAYDEIAMYNQQMAQIQSSNGACSVKAASGAMVQTKECADKAKASRAIETARKTRDAAIKEANADQMDAQAAASRAAIAKMGKEKQGSADLERAEARVKTLTDAQNANARYPYAGAKEPQIKKLAITGLQLFDQAGRTNRCCKQRSGDIDQSACDSAKNYVEAHGITVDKLNKDVTAPDRPVRTRREE